MNAIHPTPASATPSSLYTTSSVNVLPYPPFVPHLPSNCEQICSNTIGSYSCSCVSGFQLAPDGKSCLGEYLDFKHIKHKTYKIIRRATTQDKFKIDTKKKKQQSWGIYFLPRGPVYESCSLLGPKRGPDFPISDHGHGNVRPMCVRKR